MSHLVRYALCVTLSLVSSVGFGQDNVPDPSRSLEVSDPVDSALAAVEDLLVKTATVPLSPREKGLLQVITVLDGELRHTDINRSITTVEVRPPAEIVTVETGEPMWRVILFVGAAVVAGVGLGYGASRLSP